MTMPSVETWQKWHIKRMAQFKVCKNGYFLKKRFILIKGFIFNRSAISKVGLTIFDKMSELFSGSAYNAFSIIFGFIYKCIKLFNRNTQSLVWCHTALIFLVSISGYILISNLSCYLNTLIFCHFSFVSNSCHPVFLFLFVIANVFHNFCLVE